MTIKQVSVALATDGSGDESVVVLNHAFCVLKRVKCTLGTMTSGADFSITDGESQTALAADITANLDADLTTGESTIPVDIYRTFLEGPVTVTIANGGASKAAEVTLYFEF